MLFVFTTTIYNQKRVFYFVLTYVILQYWWKTFWMLTSKLKHKHLSARHVKKQQNIPLESALCFATTPVVLEFTKHLQQKLHSTIILQSCCLSAAPDIWWTKIKVQLLSKEARLVMPDTPGNPYMCSRSYFVEISHIILQSIHIFCVHYRFMARYLQNMTSASQGVLLWYHHILLTSSVFCLLFVVFSFRICRISIRICRSCNLQSHPTLNKRLRHSDAWMWLLTSIRVTRFVESSHVGNILYYTLLCLV